ncbi:hypothetical protein [Aquimarina longa]|uniref:hypothetical protein n=1 Tax=Aquimarina longa TaxID=1080221 RepID=UPI0009E9A135|nr:hypothetical protein [Aquimarina longa]
MKKLSLIAFLFVISINSIHGQIGVNDANALLGLPKATNLAEINAILSPTIGSVVFNLADEEIYRYTGLTNGWQVSTDDQLDSEVNLATSIDVDEAGENTITNETTVQEVIQAIAPITSKAARVFYPPSIEIDASSTGTGRTINLYTQYTAQFATPVASNPTAPGAIPIYNANELHYYVTFADPSVFDNISIDNAGEMTYDIISTPLTYNTLINVVFVVK